jgi:hypothetical protein
MKQRFPGESPFACLTYSCRFLLLFQYQFSQLFAICYYRCFSLLKHALCSRAGAWKRCMRRRGEAYKPLVYRSHHKPMVTVVCVRLYSSDSSHARYLRVVSFARLDILLGCDTLENCCIVHSMSSEREVQLKTSAHENYNLFERGPLERLRGNALLPRLRGHSSKSSFSPRPTRLAPSSMVTEKRFSSGLCSY